MSSYFLSTFRGLLIFTFTLCSIETMAQYAVSGINVEWLSDASAVVRSTSQDVKVDQFGKISLKDKTAITILKSDANDLAILSVPYSKMVKLKAISGIVYDASGKIIEKSKKNNIQDYSNFSSFSIFEDNRVKVLDLKQYKLPYTVEFEYELELVNLFYLPNWVPQNYSQIPVQKATATYEYPAEHTLRFFSKNITGETTAPSPKISGNIIKSWELNNLGKSTAEPLMPDEDPKYMILYAAASKFDYEGYQGDLSSWESMGRWFYLLNEGKKNLTDKTKAEIRVLVAPYTSDKEKVKALYEYMQNKTRYVSIQLGIGGLQPFDALTVEKLSYGDCKALSNYMSSLLNEVGIENYYTLIYGGRNSATVIEEFPKSYFNHVILAVPLSDETIWLECTSQTNPFGYLSDFTSNRFGLMITEEGGKLVKTPKYVAENNLQYQKATFKIYEEGSATGNLKLLTKGLQTERNNLLSVADGSTDQKKRWISENTSLPSLHLEEFQINSTKLEIPEVEVLANFESHNLLSKSGNRLVLQPNVLNTISLGLPNSKKERLHRFRNPLAFEDIDEIEYVLPDGYTPDFLPEAILLNSDFGTYQTDYKFSDGTILYNRRLLLNDGIFEAAQFEDYRIFVKSIEQADNAKIVIQKR